MLTQSTNVVVVGLDEILLEAVVNGGALSAACPLNLICAGLTPVAFAVNLMVALVMIAPFGI
jgi:hypothetical protein